VAVDEFMRGNLGFTDIAKVVDTTLSAHSGVADPSLEDVLAADRWARESVAGQLQKAQPLARSR
jgi:1-deoxy-D-xylulose-5-phosphate reductoisomerase